MKYNLDGPIPDFEDQAITVDGAEIIEEMPDVPTSKIELMPEMAHSIEELTRNTIIHTIGAAIDAMIINGVDPGLRAVIMANAIELLKARNIFDLSKF